MKYAFFCLLVVCAFVFSSCGSEMGRMVDKTCDCLEEVGGVKGRHREFRSCMGPEDYEKLGEYDHSEKEEEFTKRVRESCPEVAKDFRL